MLGWDRGIWQAVKGYFTVGYTDQSEWQITPWWHPMRWLFGKPMRRWNYDACSIPGEYDGKWEYGTYQECARSVLEEAYGDPNKFHFDYFRSIAP